jgi:tetratricopeptide (TPR) repeat protein
MPETALRSPKRKRPAPQSPGRIVGNAKLPRTLTRYVKEKHVIRTLILASFVIAVSFPAAADRYADRRQSDNMDQRIRGCSQILRGGERQSRKNRSIVYNRRGVAYAKKGQYDRAIIDFDQSIELNPRYVRAYVSRGVTYLKKGQIDQAIADYTRAIELNPRFVLGVKSHEVVIS